VIGGLFYVFFVLFMYSQINRGTLPASGGTGHHPFALPGDVRGKKRQLGFRGLNFGASMASSVAQKVAKKKKKKPSGNRAIIHRKTFFKVFFKNGRKFRPFDDRSSPPKADTAKFYFFFFFSGHLDRSVCRQASQRGAM